MGKRPICVVSLGLIFGILGGQYFEKSSSPLFFVYGAMVLGITGLTLKKQEKELCQRLCVSKGIVILLIISILCGFCYAKWIEKQKYTWNLDGKEVSFVGKVLKREKSNGMERYLIQVQKLNGKKIFPTIQVRMQTRETKQELFGYGSKIMGKGEWQEFSKSRNEGTFDEKQYRKSQGITAKISVERRNLHEQKMKKNWIDCIKEEREKFAGFLESQLGEKENALTSAIFIR